MITQDNVLSKLAYMTKLTIAFDFSFSDPIQKKSMQNKNQTRQRDTRILGGQMVHCSYIAGDCIVP